MKARVVAYYLPQFHTIPENDENWGKGFTEWVNVKKASPLFPGHRQPRIPEKNNYYNLLEKNVMEWQVELAKENGIYGFCFYHYWFDGKLLLEKPISQFLDNKSLDIHFCFSWANEPWTNAWAEKKETKVLISQNYGDEARWEEHFMYLLPFFSDPRYIRIDGKPLFILYRIDIIPNLNLMLDYWQRRAKECGFPGLDFAYQNLFKGKQQADDESRFSFQIHFEPTYTHQEIHGKDHILLRKFKWWLSSVLERYTKITLASVTIYKGPRFYDYDEVWRKILSRRISKNNIIPGAYVDWDNSSRRGSTAIIHKGVSPQKFKVYFSELVNCLSTKYSTDLIFLFSWNEWCEGGYLEPDTENGTSYLAAIKDAVKDDNEQQ